MYAFVTLVIIVSLTLLIVRVSPIARTTPGVSKEVASFQSLSAFSGAGFTSEEADVLARVAHRHLLAVERRLDPETGPMARSDRKTTALSV